jgi:hypothetical protein
VDNPQHPLRAAHPTTPLLLLNGLHDHATGYKWATDVARQLGPPASERLTYDS